MLQPSFQTKNTSRSPCWRSNQWNAARLLCCCLAIRDYFNTFVKPRDEPAKWSKVALKRILRHERQALPAELKTSDDDRG